MGLLVRLKLLSCRYPGEKVHCDGLCPLQTSSSTWKSSAPHAKTDRGGLDDSIGCTVVTPVHKIPPTRSRGVFFSTFLWSTKILSNTHSQHPAAAGEEWSLLKCSSSLCVPVSWLWMPSVLRVTRDLSTKGHRLCGSDRHSVCALTPSNPELS